VIIALASPASPGPRSRAWLTRHTERPCPAHTRMAKWEREDKDPHLTGPHELNCPLQTHTNSTDPSAEALHSLGQRCFTQLTGTCPAPRALCNRARERGSPCARREHRKHLCGLGTSHHLPSPSVFFGTPRQTPDLRLLACRGSLPSMFTTSACCKPPCPARDCAPGCPAATGAAGLASPACRRREERMI